MRNLSLGPSDQMIELDATRKTIIKPVGDPIKLIMLDEANRPVADENYLKLRWAARYIACDWFLEFNKKEPAEMVPGHSMTE